MNNKIKVSICEKSLHNKEGEFNAFDVSKQMPRDWKVPAQFGREFWDFEMVFPFHLDSDRLLGALNESNFTEGDPIWKAMDI